MASSFYIDSDIETIFGNILLYQYIEQFGNLLNIYSQFWCADVLWCCVCTVLFSMIVELSVSR